MRPLLRGEWRPPLCGRRSRGRRSWGHRHTPDPHDGCGDERQCDDVAAEERRAQRIVPQIAVTLDPVETAAALAPSEHARSAPRLLGSAFFTAVHGDALRKIDET